MSMKKPYSADVANQKKAEMLSEARRYVKNAKETLKSTDIIENALYTDVKYVRKAAGIAYLAALEAIEAWMMGVGLIQNKKDKPESIEAYQLIVNQMSFKNKVMNKLNIAYETLHIAAYYRKNRTTVNMKLGLKAVEDIIDIIEHSGK